MSGHEFREKLGAKLQQLRLARGLTLQEVCERVGLSPSFLSMVENGKSGISFANVQKLLQCYGATFAVLANEQKPSDKVVRLNEAQIIGPDLEGVEMRLLTRGTLGRKIEPVLFYMEPGASIGYMQHEGEEFAYIIRGVIEVSLVDPVSSTSETYILHEGDTIYYSSTYRHKYTNIGNERAVFLAAVTPPTF